MKKLKLLIAIFGVSSLLGCATTYTPRTVEGAQCKMQCSTSIDQGLGGIAYTDRMNQCLSACKEMEDLKAKGK